MSILKAGVSADIKGGTKCGYGRREEGARRVTCTAPRGCPCPQGPPGNPKHSAPAVKASPAMAANKVGQCRVGWDRVGSSMVEWGSAGQAVGGWGRIG